MSAVDSELPMPLRYARHTEMSRWVDTNCMDAHQKPELEDRDRAAWLAGYEAAIADVVEIVEGLGGPAFSNLSAPVLLRLKTRFLQLRLDPPSRAA